MTENNQSAVPKILYLIPDTNLFVQCKPLTDLDWSKWKNFDEVRLIVTRPVQAEIDAHKNKGKDRLARKARSTNTLFREIIRGTAGAQIARNSAPKVTVHIEPQHKPNPDLSTRLNYTERDDQLVGIASTFIHENAGVDARILTHDTGPMASAKMVGVPFEEIPDNWLLPSEASESEKKIAALESELGDFRRAEPKFEITCTDAEGKECEKLKYEAEIYDALGKDDILRLIETIKAKHPVETNFGPREPASRDSKDFASRLFSVKEQFTPASQEEIEKYQRDYQNWIGSCEEFFKEYHDKLQGRVKSPRFCFVVSNNGTRPAKEALVTIEAEGNFTILPPAPPPDEDDADKQKEHKPLRLPRPPSPPKGKWSPWLGGNFLPDATLRALARVGSAEGIMVPSLFKPIEPYMSPRHDPEGFYYKTGRLFPTERFSLTCDRWRHGVGTEEFVGEISFEPTATSVSGVLECRIHAENLSREAKYKVPVRVEIRHVAIVDKAKSLIEWLALPWMGDD